MGGWGGQWLIEGGGGRLSGKGTEEWTKNVTASLRLKGYMEQWLYRREKEWEQEMETRDCLGRGEHGGKRNPFIVH